MSDQPKTQTPPRIEIPPVWAEVMQNQLNNRTVAKAKVSQYMMQHNVQDDTQIIDFIQTFGDECMKRIKESSYLVGPEGAFQVMAFGLAGIAMIDITLEIIVDGLQKQAEADAALAKPKMEIIEHPDGRVEVPVEIPIPEDMQAHSRPHGVINDSVDTHDNSLHVTNGSDNEPSSRIITE